MARRKKADRAPKPEVFDTPYWFDRARSLAGLEGRAPPSQAVGQGRGGLIERYSRAYHTPTGKLTAEDLHLLFTQGQDPHFLVPLALPFFVLRGARIDHYTEQLMMRVLGLGDSFWSTHPHLHRELSQLLSAPEATLPASNEELQSYVRSFLRRQRPEED